MFKFGLTLLFRSSSWTTPVRSRLATHLCWIATLLTSPASSMNWKRNATGVLARSWRTTPSLWSLVMLPWWSWSPASPCVWSPSPSTLLWVASLCVTWSRPWPWVSSSPWRRWSLPVKWPSLLPRRSESYRNPCQMSPLRSFWTVSMMLVALARVAALAQMYGSMVLL